MTPAAFKTVYLLLALAALPRAFAGLSQVLAGLACIQRNHGKHDCAEKCKGYWGYVMNTSEDSGPDPPSVLSTRCGLNETPTPSDSSPPSETPAADSIRDEVLTEHNNFRALHGAPPLTWNEDLEAAARNWVSQCVYENGGNLGIYGENLAARSGNFTVTDGIKSWTAEAEGYSLQVTFDRVHFAQVVWKDTKHVGCAINTCPPGTIFPEEVGDSRFLVCEYHPPGIFFGKFEDNVQA